MSDETGHLLPRRSDTAFSGFSPPRDDRAPPHHGYAPPYDERKRLLRRSVWTPSSLGHQKDGRLIARERCSVQEAGSLSLEGRSRQQRVSPAWVARGDGGGDALGPVGHPFGGVDVLVRGGVAAVALGALLEGVQELNGIGGVWPAPRWFTRHLVTVLCLARMASSYAPRYASTRPTPSVWSQGRSPGRALGCADDAASLAVGL